MSDPVLACALVIQMQNVFKDKVDIIKKFLQKIIKLKTLVVHFWMQISNFGCKTKFWMQNQVFYLILYLQWANKSLYLGTKERQKERKKERKIERKFDKLTEFLRMSKHIEVSKGLMNKGVDWKDWYKVLNKQAFNVCKILIWKMIKMYWKFLCVEISIRLVKTS